MEDALRRLVDRAAISDLAHRYATGVDTRDWVLFASCFTDPVHVDYSSASGDPGGSTPLGPFVATVGPHMEGFDATHHISANHVITFQGEDEATCVSYMQATHTLDAAQWVVGGYYTNTVVRVGDDWKISRLVLTKTWETGDPGLRLRAHAHGE